MITCSCEALSCTLHGTRLKRECEVLFMYGFPGLFFCRPSFPDSLAWGEGSLPYQGSHASFSASILRPQWDHRSAAHLFSDTLPLNHFPNGVKDIRTGYTANPFLCQASFVDVNSRGFFPTGFNPSSVQIERYTAPSFLKFLYGATILLPPPDWHSSSLLLLPR